MVAVWQEICEEWIDLVPLIFKAFTFALVAAVATACASGPHVMVLPGEGKTLDQFHGDDTFCRGLGSPGVGVRGWMAL
jgi:hypothetical protein